MKESLREKNLKLGRLAQELRASEGYQEAQKKQTEHKETLLKEVLSEKIFEEIRYKAGFIEGMAYLDNLLGIWYHKAKRSR